MGSLLVFSLLTSIINASLHPSTELDSVLDLDSFSRTEDDSLMATESTFFSEISMFGGYTGWVERDFPLCQHLDDKLIGKRSGNYIPAIQSSPEFEGKCTRRDFELTGETLGTGTFGEVKKARHINSDRFYALKYIKYDPDDEAAMSAIRQEECLQHRMSNVPSVARHYCTYGISKHQEQMVVLVMELIAGPDLFDTVYNKAREYDSDDIMAWTAQLLLTIRALHARNIVLLDLKLENVIIEQGTSNLKLIDFGLAGDPTQPSRFSLGEKLGTPMYTPPEYIKDTWTTEGDEEGFVTADEDCSEDQFHSVDSSTNTSSSSADFSDPHKPAVDWYAFGLLLYELLYHSPPWDIPDENEPIDGLYYNIKHTGVRCGPCKNLNDNLLIELIRGFTEKDPSRRLGIRKDSRRIIDGHPYFRGLRPDAFHLAYRK